MLCSPLVDLTLGKALSFKHFVFTYYFYKNLQVVLRLK